jgi:hypothetical protein
MSRGWPRFAQLSWAAGFLCAAPLPLLGADGPVTQDQLKQLQRQNELLEQQVRKQQQLIDDLTGKVATLERKQSTDGAEPEPTAAKPRGFSLGNLHFSGQGGVAFFRSEAHGPAPNSEFRIDEAKLFVEAPLWNDTYFFAELNITTRESRDTYLEPGELYVDFENISRLWNRDRQVNLRIGRLDIPFGEEYLTRDAIDNPLISHSLSDLWGVDEGVELYGTIAGVSYVVAVQNGGHPALRDFNEDKSIAARLSYDPARWLHLSGSAMRTGALDVRGDKFSELWFGNDFIRSLAPATTTRFEANLLEADVHARWAQGHVKGAGGYLKYDDDDPLSNNQREVYYYYVEALQHLTRQLYAAGRWSQVLAPDGFSIVGDGDSSDYSIDNLTENLWRLSLGLGWRWNQNLLLKAEYTFNQGKTLAGEERRHENIAAAEVAFRF